MRLLLVFAVLLLASCTSTETEIADIVRKHLRDPGSAEFSGVTVIGEGEGRVACGRVNAKNGFGGYAGEQPFMLRGRQLWIGAGAESADIATCCNLFQADGEGWPQEAIDRCRTGLPEPIRLP